MTKIQICQELSLTVAPGGSLAAALEGSPFVALKQARDLIDAVLAGLDPVDDWLARLVDRSNPASLVDLDEAFACYVTWAISAGVGRADRKSIAPFQAALVKSGIPVSKDDTGRLVCHGAALRQAVRVIDAEQVAHGLDRFLAECCTTDRARDELRAGAAVFHSTYRAWVQSDGGVPMGIRELRQAMVARGFKSRTSNGTKWLGLSLNIAPSGSDNVPRAPKQGRKPPRSKLEGAKILAGRDGKAGQQ